MLSDGTSGRAAPGPFCRIPATSNSRMTPKQRLDRARTCYRLWTLHQSDRSAFAPATGPEDSPEETSGVSLKIPTEADSELETNDGGPATLPILAERPAGERWQESVMIYDGFYRGRKFVASEFTGIWFIEEDELKIQNAHGVRLATLDAAKMAAILDAYEHEQGAEPMRRAA